MILKMLFFLMAMLFMVGCATMRTVESPKKDCPDVYSGTLFDIHTILGSNASAKKYGAHPPKYPLADLPASFLLDTLFLPVTIACTTGLYFIPLGL